MDALKVIERLVQKKYGIIDREAIASVGMLCKRVDLLDKNKIYSPDFFKDLAKEIIYEQSRVLKKLCRAIFIPSLTFIPKKSKEI